MSADRTRRLDVPLWGGRSQFKMRVFFPDGEATKPRPAMLVFRGGAYASCKGSGVGAAEWVAEQGLVGVEAEYGSRTTNRFFPDNHADAARAVRLLRSHAAAWGIDPHRIAVMGFSAGGHLATLLSTQPKLHAAAEDDLAQHFSARPNLVVLGYPLLSFVDSYVPGAFLGSVENFFGRGNVTEQTRRQFSSELHVEHTHPPVFIWTTDDDRLVPSTHSKLFSEACRREQVPVQFELYPHGPHGMGLALDQPSPVRDWTTHLLAWLEQRWDIR